MAEPVWKHYLTDYNEGLGVVYERFMLNDYFDRILKKYSVKTVLEAPIYGMAGVSGINSVHFAQRGCSVTLVEEDAERLAGVKRIWEELALPVNIVHNQDMTSLPFADASFDLVWNFAALWYLPDAEPLLREMVRVSKKMILVSMPNSIQVGYLLRKHVIDKEFFQTIDENWVNIGRVRNVLERQGAKVVQTGVLDVPPWPDTCMPAAEFLKRVGIKSKKLESNFTSSGWQWSTMDYYLGKDETMKRRVSRYAFLDKAPLPWWLKAVWAHHRYLLLEKN